MLQEEYEDYLQNTSEYVLFIILEISYDTAENEPGLAFYFIKAREP